ncbi:hypothetical protein A6046_00120 [[Haemophilus] ducreyi]|uniref:TorD/DmsD family molecular chaperone n=1 Tax=Haemophilus ducreyi TaxID=730 RepID=UPI0007CDCF5D|nr:molecular chaperone [[Haemophilus] ducreyi]ANF74097.1 hypothetical protein A6045_06765 [[Haemophilus] ducreyi]ANF74533.1 hypothetical protein A6046_00120 [[Haemophilus] ducreyi]
MKQTTINDFSLLCRLFGNLFYRSPADPILTDTFSWLAQAGLRQQWALTLDSQSDFALSILEKNANPSRLITSYQALFGENGTIPTDFAAYDISIDEFIAFRQARDMPKLDQPNHIALLLLTASWLEDNATSTLAQQQLFEQFLLPCLSKFLGKVEAHDPLFYKALAQLTRDTLAAMADELEEEL